MEIMRVYTVAVLTFLVVTEVSAPHCPTGANDVIASLAYSCKCTCLDCHSRSNASDIDKLFPCSYYLSFADL